MRRAALIALANGLLLLAAPIAGAEMALADFPEPSALPARPHLPDPLVMLDGSHVETPKEWAERRRPELKALFQHYMYGWLPPAVPVAAAIEREDTHYFGGRATKKEVAITFGDPASTIHLLLVVPNKREGPVPAFLGLNFHGNHAVLPDPTITLPTAWMPQGGPGVTQNKAGETGRGRESGVWSIERVVARGYALATFYCGDVAPDHPGFEDGVFPAFAKGRGPDEWGAVAAWAWGLSRALDYLETVAEVDKSRVAVIGHSRLGKAALLAGAFDERFALTIAHQAGCGGSAPSRGRKVGEQVKQINDRFPHWFAAKFAEVQ